MRRTRYRYAPNFRYTLFDNPTWQLSAGSAGKDFRRKANMRVVLHPNPADIGKPHALRVAARREVLVGNEDLPKSATAPSPL